MKFQAVVMATGCSVWMLAAAAAPAPSPAVEAAEPVKSVEELIGGLADDRFRVREQASFGLWKLGETALPALRAAAEGQEPEQAYRAREVIRKIELFITPETDPSIIDLVERYVGATAEQKPGIFEKLNRKKAWRQILKLYVGETNPEIQSNLGRQLQDPRGSHYGISGVAVIAARECLMRGDSDGAREFLEMAPADASGLLSLADFHRSQGTWDAEMKRALTLTGAKADAWQLALHRAAGNAGAARAAADTAGETKIAAAMAMLAGDPLPWMRTRLEDDSVMQSSSLYTELAIKRWQGAQIHAADLEPLERLANSRSPADRETGINSLFLLGEMKRGEAAYAKISPVGNFLYLDSLERIPEALAAIGLGGESPDFDGWVDERMQRLLKADEAEDDDQDGEADFGEIMALANFFERRGVAQQNLDVFLKPLVALAGEDEEKFTDLLGRLFSDPKVSGGAPRLALAVAIAWAGDKESRWDDLIDIVFSENDQLIGLWSWSLEVSPQASRGERLEALLALTGKIPDSHGLRGTWLDRIWELLEKTEAGKRAPVVGKVMILTTLMPDLATSLKAGSFLAEGDAAGIPAFLHAANALLDGGSEKLLEQIGYETRVKSDPNPVVHAIAAASLRRAGRPAEAAAEDVLVEKLALGRDAFAIAGGYTSGNEFKTAAKWLGRAVLQMDPEDGLFLRLLVFYGQELLETGDWKTAAAVFEVLAQQGSNRNAGTGSPGRMAGTRLEADMARAFANLGADRAGSIAALRKCHAMVPSDGSLADYFFPGLRKAGLIQEHDELFKVSWDGIAAVLKEYPESDNTFNTAGWMAAKARRNLAEAEAIELKALARNPHESAYLDTMAEIEFVKGNRAKALEWSAKAVNFSPVEDVLRRQYEHFRNDPMPVGGE